MGDDATDDAEKSLSKRPLLVHVGTTVEKEGDSAPSFRFPRRTRAQRLESCLHKRGACAHLVAVSTCYVAGNRRGNAPEILVSAGPFDVGIDWRSEVAATRRLRSDTDALSRTPDQLKVFRKAARAEIGAAGAPALASKTEDLRQKWVKSELVKAGRSRAASVGWPDAYAFTKALGEQALTDVKGDVPVSIVRPSIIESALAEPKPGWIRGFRMAEPVIISFAKGLLKEFPLEEYLLMEKNEDWFGTFAENAPDEVRFIATTEPATVRTMMSRGELQITDQWQTVEALGALDEIEGVEVAAFPVLTEFYYMIHTKKPPTDDVHFRRAMAYAFDYDAAVSLEWPGTQQSQGPVPAITAGHNPDVFMFTRDLDKARELLDEIFDRSQGDRHRRASRMLRGPRPGARFRFLGPARRP